MRTTTLVLAGTLLLACGGSAPPPKTDDAPPPVTSAASTAPRRPGSGPSVSQELGSIDERAVQATFGRLQAKLETCHAAGRGRVEYLAGDVKVFLRIGQDGQVRYGWLEDSTLGDRETEKCLLDLFAATAWPKPEGGEAEVRNGFGWSGGGERAPATWPADKVKAALGGEGALDACKVPAGDLKVTGYVEPAPEEPAEAPAPAAAKGADKGHGPGAKDHGKKPAAKASAAPPPPSEPHGRFKAVGVSAKTKDGAAKADCVVDALKTVTLPSPGSYAAKVTFTL